MTNPKIEKVNSDIAKTKAKIAEYTAKLRALERHKISLENEEIVALYRRENFNDDEFTALLRSQRKIGNIAAHGSLEDETRGEGSESTQSKITQNEIKIKSENKEDKI